MSTSIGTEATEAFDANNPCGWYVYTPYNEDGERYEVPCGAPTVNTEREWYCAKGHGHVYMEARYNEGWDYAGDEQEADMLMSAGTMPVRDF